MYAHPYAITNFLIQQVDVRKLDLLQYTFSLNFYFLVFLSHFPSMFSLSNLFSMIHFFICHLPKTLKTRKCKKLIHSDNRNSLKLFCDYRILQKNPKLTIGSNGRPIINPSPQTLHPQLPSLPPSPQQAPPSYPHPELPWTPAHH